MGTAVAVAAVALGACLIEKHFTDSRKIKSPDSFFSIEPSELKDLVREVRTAEKALGSIHYGLTVGERKSRIFRRSLFVVKDIKKGERFTQNNIRSIRPSYGLTPRFYASILGRKAKKDIKRGTPLVRAVIC